jgi:hypothetical protein
VTSARLKRMFGIEINTCTCCGGALKMIASIEQPRVIAKILAGAAFARAAPVSTRTAGADPFAVSTTGGYRRCGPGRLRLTSASQGLLAAGFTGPGLTKAGLGPAQGPSPESRGVAEAT